VRIEPAGEMTDGVRKARRHPGERESRGKFPAGTSRNGGGRRLRGVPQEGRYPHRTDEETIMSTEENKAIVGRWFTEFWGKEFNPAVIDELAAPDIRFEYSLHEALRGRDAVRAFAEKFRAAFPDLNFWGTADLIAEGDYVVGQWEGGGTHTGDAFDDMPYGPLPASTGKTMRFTGTTVLKVENGLITEEIGLDDGVTALSQLGLITGA
jgi:predicted ester cyclase